MKFLLGLLLLAAPVWGGPVFTFTDSPTTTISPTFTPTPVPTQGMYCASYSNSVTAGVADNYGTWDGANVWFSCNQTGTLYKISPGSSPMTVTTYTGPTDPLCMAYDGTNIWVGSSNSDATLTEYSTSGTQIGTWNVLPGGEGFGGIQGILWDGSHIWLGISQVSSNSLPAIGRWNTSTHSLDVQYDQASNVNGISYYFDDNGVEHVLAGNGSVDWQVNGTTGDLEWSATVASTLSYRITNDGTYAYDAQFTSPGTVQKEALSDGSVVASWDIGNLLNAITFDGQYLWTVDNSHNVNVTDTNGNAMCWYGTAGLSDAVYAYNLGLNGSMFTLDSNQNSGSPSDSSTVWWYQLAAYPSLTPTPTPFYSPTISPTPSASPTATESPIETPTPVPSPVYTFTDTVTATQTATISPTPTVTPEYSATVSPTPDLQAPTATPTWGFF